MLFDPVYRNFIISPSFQITMYYNGDVGVRLSRLHRWHDPVALERIASTSVFYMLDFEAVIRVQRSLES